MKLITHDKLKGIEPRISKMLAIVYNLDGENDVYYVLLDENEIENLNPAAISHFVQEEIGKPFSKSRVDYYAKDKNK